MTFVNKCNLNLRKIEKACDNLKRKYEKIAKISSENIKNAYKKSIGAPLQVFMGKTSDDTLNTWGVSVNILKQSYLLDVFYFYCREKKYNYEEIAKKIREQEEIKKIQKEEILIKNNDGSMKLNQLKKKY